MYSGVFTVSGAASIALIAAAGLSVVQISLIHYKSLGQSGVSALDIFDIKGCFSQSQS